MQITKPQNKTFRITVRNEETNKSRTITVYNAASEDDLIDVIKRSIETESVSSEPVTTEPSTSDN